MAWTPPALKYWQAFIYLGPPLPFYKKEVLAVKPLQGKTPCTGPSFHLVHTNVHLSTFTAPLLGNTKSQ